MTPGRTRNQGIELYEQGLVGIVSKREEVIQAKVDAHHLQYASEDKQTRCGCDLFAKEEYYEHLAALEHFLRNNAEGRELPDESSPHQET